MECLRDEMQNKMMLLLFMFILVYSSLAYAIPNNKNLVAVTPTSEIYYEGKGAGRVVNHDYTKYVCDSKDCSNISSWKEEYQYANLSFSGTDLILSSPQGTLNIKISVKYANQEFSLSSLCNLVQCSINKNINVNSFYKFTHVINDIPSISTSNIQEIILDFTNVTIESVIIEDPGSGVNETLFIITKDQMINLNDLASSDLILNWSKNRLIITNFTFLKQQNNKYSITLDPAVELTSSNIVEDLSFELLDLDGLVYRTTINTGVVSVGERNPILLEPGKFRALIEYNFTGVFPEGINVTDVNLSKNFSRLGQVNNRWLAVYEIESNLSIHNDDDTNNSHLYKDIGNGTNYHNQTIAGGGTRMVDFNLSKLDGDHADITGSQINADLDIIIANKRKWWSFGVKSNENNTVASTAEPQFSSSENTDAGVRPVLTITYRDTQPPQFKDFSEPPDPSWYQFNNTWLFNVNVTDNLAGTGTVIFQIDNRNFTATNNTFTNHTIYINQSDPNTHITSGTHTYKWYANDSLGQWNESASLTFTINNIPAKCGFGYNCTYLYNSTDGNATIIDNEGNINLSGFFVNKTSKFERHGISFRAFNLSETSPFWINNTGDMMCGDAIFDKNKDYCTPIGPSYIIYDNQSRCIFYVNTSGYCWLRGNLTMNARNS